MVVKKISELVPKGAPLGNTDLLVVGVDNGFDYDLKSVTGAQLLGNVITQTITNGDTSHSPSSDVVYDSLALKVDKVVGSRLITSAESTLLGNTSGVNSGNETNATISTIVNSATLSSAPNDTDKLPISNVLGTIKGLTWSNIKSYLLSYFNDIFGRLTTTTTGTLITFLVPVEYGTFLVPESGNITNNLTGAKVGYLQKIYHNNSVEPTFPVGWVKISGNYKQSSLNIILAYYCSPTRIEYSYVTDTSNLVTSNTAITGDTKTKITYDSKGLVTSGADATTSDIADSLNKRYVTDANLTVIGNQSGTNTGDETVTTIKTKLGITTLSGSNTGDQDLSGLMVKSNNLSDLTNTTTARTNLGLGSLATQSGTFSGTSSGTNTGDQIISDATITTTDITTNDFTTSKHGFVPKGTNVGKFLKDDGTWGTPASGGIWGIANASGVYTYYTTWALAVASATAGQCIELFADITESAVSYTLKNGVNINGNGHSVSFSVVDGFVATSSPTICQINNIVVNQASATFGLYINANGSIIGGNATFNSNNASGYGVYGRSVARIYGFTCNGYNPMGASNFFSPKAVIDNVYVESLGGAINAGTLSNSIIKTSAAGNVPVSDCGTVNNCYIYSNGGIAIVATSTMEVNNCTIVSVTSMAVNGNGITFNNCWIKSLANAVQGNGTFNNCTLVASTTPINTYLGGGLFNNCTITANASVVFDLASTNAIINNCNIICNYNNAGGHGFNYSFCYVNNSFIKLANSSATAFYSPAGLTMYLANNSIKGTTNFKNANVTNGQTNTADAQGNVILQ